MLWCFVCALILNMLDSILSQSNEVAPPEDVIQINRELKQHLDPVMGLLDQDDPNHIVTTVEKSQLEQTKDKLTREREELLGRNYRDYAEFMSGQNTGAEKGHYDRMIEYVDWYLPRIEARIQAYDPTLVRPALNFTPLTPTSAPGSSGNSPGTYDEFQQSSESSSSLTAITVLVICICAIIGSIGVTYLVYRRLPDAPEFKYAEEEGKSPREFIQELLYQNRRSSSSTIGEHILCNSITSDPEGSSYPDPHSPDTNTYRKSSRFLP